MGPLAYMIVHFQTIKWVSLVMMHRSWLTSSRDLGLIGWWCCLQIQPAYEMSSPFLSWKSSTKVILLSIQVMLIFNCKQVSFAFAAVFFSSWLQETSQVIIYGNRGSLKLKPCTWFHRLKRQILEQNLIYNLSCICSESWSVGQFPLFFFFLWGRYFLAKKLLM